MTGANNISQPEMLLVGDGYKLLIWSSQEGIVIHRLSDLPGLHGFVRHFAAFCKNSNGFSQY
jgi:hypothetical protein